MNSKAAVVSVDGLLRGESQVRILRFLWKNRAEWSGREIARRIGLSAPACHEALRKLNSRGLVLFKRISNLHIYKINADSYLLKKVLAPLFKSEKSAAEQIVKLVRRCLVQGRARKEIAGISMFGSMARGGGKMGSDLDLLVVVRRKKSAEIVGPDVERLRKTLARQFNIPLSPYLQTLGEFREKHLRGLPLIHRIIRESRHIYGKEPGELIS